MLFYFDDKKIVNSILDISKLQSGKEILNDDKTINRAYLRSVILNDKNIFQEFLQYLENKNYFISKKELGRYIQVLIFF